MVEINKTYEELIILGVSEETLRLAQQVAFLPPEHLDAAGIDAWAKRLAVDISKGRD